MSSVSKAEYLKKYLTDGTEVEKKKKKKKTKASQGNIRRLKIVDDDVDFKSLLPDNLGNTLEEDVGDNDPTIADFIDERPEYVKQLEKYREDQRWRILGDDKKESHESNISTLTKQRHDSDSSPRGQRHDYDFGQSPLRRKRHDSDSDQSLPRRKRHDSDSDQSLPRRKRHDSDSDQSLPRRKRNDSDSDQSLPRRKRHDSDSDQSPPRRKRCDSDSDQSPPRRKRRDSDQSPPRRKRRDSDQSPPRRKRHEYDSDQSPPRRKKSKKHESRESLSNIKKKSRWEVEEDKYTEEEKRAVALEAIKDARGRAAKTLGGATAGLSSAAQMKHEAKIMRQREDEMFRKLDDEALGKNARTVHRDKKSGRRRNAEEEEEISAEEAAKAAAKAEKYKAWNKGLKQAQIQQQALEEVMHEMDKPLTRNRDDADLDAHLKAQEREGDPMLAFIKKKKSNKDAKKKELPRYSGPEPLPNRFNIWPGYRWDGVDRSNGFEKKFFSKLSEKRAIKEIAYKWSVEDM
ncbi:hypothetical protein LSH36_51g01011 [Paralvinella palmiformis]|uniref:BUD13 homolog n=1 Tax=Paralvinella palmiformis TaxID=53620 RepID=A0AAD9K5K0_9ANNE|nr:hypothetical protein LSH36_51g01011 [Paralvinella palmiformis]